MIINIESNLGKVSFALSCEIKQGMELAVMQAGIASIGYRAGGSKAFNAKGHSRDEIYSEQLAADVKTAVSASLDKFCKILKFETSAKPASKEKITVESVLASLDTAVLEKLLAEKKAAQVNEPQAESISVG